MLDAPLAHPPEKSHFADQSTEYRNHRPHYEDSFFDWLVTMKSSMSTIWDCGCGSGQATVGVAERFHRVIATDAEANQLKAAPYRENVEYRLEPAEKTSIASQSIDLTLVAQALHWFDHEAFYREVTRVSKRGGAVVAVTYNLLEVEGCEQAISHLYSDILGPYWPEERRHVEDGYKNLPFPFPRIEAPILMMEATWTYDHLIGYLHSWSAFAAYKAQHGQNPIEAIEASLRKGWGAPELAKVVRWPLTILAGRVNQ